MPVDQPVSDAATSSLASRVRRRAAMLAVLAMALAGFFQVSSTSRSPSPGALLSSSSDFSISGTVSNLAPGVSSTLSLTISNPQTAPLSVNQITVQVSPDPAGCSALINLTLHGASFTGNPPSVTITGSPLPQSVPAKSGSVNGTATVLLPILVARSSDNGCQAVTFPFAYSGQASFTAPTATALTSSPNPSLFAHPVTFTATVTASPASTNPAIGTATFYRCTNPANLPSGSPASACITGVAIAPAQALNGAGQASFTTSNLPSGSSPIYAAFTPTVSTNYSSSASTTITQAVGFSTPCITTSVNGGYTVAAGQSICIVSPGRVNGGVTVQSTGALYLNGATINGSVGATGASALRFCSSTINGGVTSSGATGFVMIGDGGDDGSPACAGNSVNGGITVSGGTGSFEAAGNSISGGASFSSNTGTAPFEQDGAAEIEGNTINGGLSCTTNNPAPTNGGQKNTVNGTRSGQCSAVSF